jgi:hypothetical protein
LLPSTKLQPFYSVIKCLQDRFCTYEKLHISNELRAYCRKLSQQRLLSVKSVAGIGDTAAGIVIPHEF